MTIPIIFTLALILILFMGAACLGMKVGEKIALRESKKNTVNLEDTQSTGTKKL